MTQGALAPKLITLAAPLIAGNILQTVYNLADMFWVGRLGANAVAAVSIIFPTEWLLISMAMGVTIAGAALVSQWTGAGQPEEANRAAGQTLALSFIIAVALAALAYSGRFLLLRFLGASGPLFEPTLAYVSVIFWAVPFTFLFLAYRSVMQAGDTVRPMYLVIFSNLLNIVLDPLLIFGVGPFPALGVAGAAWATLTSRAVAAVIGTFLLFHGGMAIRLRPAHLLPHGPTIRRLLSVGIPGGVDGAARSFSAVAMIAIVTRFGPVATAAYGIGVRVMSRVWTISGARGQAVATGVGQNLGADQSARAARVSRLGTVMTLLAIGMMGVLAVICAAPIMRVFVQDAQVIAEGTAFLRISGWGFGFSGALMVIQGAFHGAGRTSYSMVLSVLNRWILRLARRIVGVDLRHGACRHVVVLPRVGRAFGFSPAQHGCRGRWQKRLIAGE